MRGNYRIVLRTPALLVIEDTRQGISVTNSAEAVVAELTETLELGNRRLVYYDTDRNTDELLHDGRGRFTGFAPARGRRVCAYCSEDLGPSYTRLNSHGCCESCYGKELDKLQPDAMDASEREDPVAKRLGETARRHNNSWPGSDRDGLD